MTGISLPGREGDAPLVTGPEPHEQVTQTAPPEYQERLFDLAAALPGVEVGPSFVSVPGTRAFHLAPSMARGPVDAFQAGTEFAHIHPSYDGSLHLTLPPELKLVVVEAGWGVLHPHTGTVLLFGPRHDDELEVAWRLVRTSYRYALGEEDRSPPLVGTEPVTRWDGSGNSTRERDPRRR